jgi:hypothetical protein
MGSVDLQTPGGGRDEPRSGLQVESHGDQALPTGAESVGRVFSFT